MGEWLPEPIITDGHDDPARHAETADSLSLAMLVLLESLSPEQRAVLLLHDVFDYDHAQIAQIIGKSQDNVRQLATRARRHLQQRRPRFQTTREQRDELARRFFQAAEHVSSTTRTSAVSGPRTRQRATRPAAPAGAVLDAELFDHPLFPARPTRHRGGPRLSPDRLPAPLPPHSMIRVGGGTAPC